MASAIWWAKPEIPKAWWKVLKLKQIKWQPNLWIFPASMGSLEKLAPIYPKATALGQGLPSGDPVIGIIATFSWRSSKLACYSPLDATSKFQTQIQAGPFQLLERKVCICRDDAYVHVERASPSAAPHPIKPLKHSKVQSSSE